MATAQSCGHKCCGTLELAALELAELERPARTSCGSACSASPPAAATLLRLPRLTLAWLLVVESESESESESELE